MATATSFDTPAGESTWPAPYTRGLYWTEMTVGSSFATASRTVTESDLANFVGMGFTEPLFLDASGAAAAGYRGRLVPGALTFSLAEGLVMLTNVIHGTGMAFLGTTITVKAPVFVGDTLEVSWTVTAARPASSGRRGVVTTKNLVRNQHGEVVMEYEPVRLIAAAPEPTDEGHRS
ncbi:MaoC family dehydratase [Rhodococcus aetherivorans]|uniref:MaoC family dehydratase n=1 Tax=Rhodococcus aetherivorans TaxID=191292 RepID=UPI00163B26B7|nr:MaoC family dehydratase N-terminal domain-containing protein [Rhodococcus aetherivorans]MBC2592365.1 MaoC family dehydratase N-terminal domain-containing protein [Rhodococcus aetherivorans]